MIKYLTVGYSFDAEIEAARMYMAMLQDDNFRRRADFYHSGSARGWNRIRRHIRH